MKRVFAGRDLRVRDIDAAALDKSHQARHQIDLRGLEIADAERIEIDLVAAERLKPDLEMDRRMRGLGGLHQFHTGATGNATGDGSGMPIGQARFLFGDQYRSGLGPRRDQDQAEQKTNDFHVVHRTFSLTNAPIWF